MTQLRAACECRPLTSAIQAEKAIYGGLWLSCWLAVCVCVCVCVQFSGKCRASCAEMLTTAALKQLLPASMTTTERGCWWWCMWEIWSVRGDGGACEWCEVWEGMVVHVSDVKCERQWRCMWVMWSVRGDGGACEWCGLWVLMVVHVSDVKCERQWGCMWVMWFVRGLLINKCRQPIVLHRDYIVERAFLLRKVVEHCQRAINITSGGDVISGLAFSCERCFMACKLWA